MGWKGARWVADQRRAATPEQVGVAAMLLTLHNDCAGGVISLRSDTGIPQLWAFTRQNMLDDLHHIRADDVGTWEEWIERCAGACDECRSATGA